MIIGVFSLYILRFLSWSSISVESTQRKTKSLEDGDWKLNVQNEFTWASLSELEEVLLPPLALVVGQLLVTLWHQLEVLDRCLSHTAFEVVNIGVALGVPTWWIVNEESVLASVPLCVIGLSCLLPQDVLVIQLHECLGLLSGTILVHGKLEFIFSREFLLNLWLLRSFTRSLLSYLVAVKLRKHYFHFPDVADIAHLIPVDEGPVLLPQILFVVGPLHFFGVPGISVVVEDILVLFVVDGTEFAKAFRAVPADILVILQLDHIIVVDRELLLLCTQDLNLLTSAFLQVELKCRIHFVHKGGIPLDYEEELTNLWRQWLHYQRSTSAHVSAKDEFLHEINIEVFVKVWQIYFLACLGYVKRTEQILIDYRLLLSSAFTRAIALTIFAFLRMSSFLNLLLFVFFYRYVLTSFRICREVDILSLYSQLFL